MIKKCQKCNRELDTNKDFCVLCGESYKNEELDNKKKEKIIEEQKEEIKVEIKEENKSVVIPIIIYGLAIVLLGPLLLGILSFLSIASMDVNEVSYKHPLLIILLILVIVSVIGIILLLRKDNKSNQKK